MIKTNCELPLCMFHDNYELNDFDFVLFHLYACSDEYRDYYKLMKTVHPDRLMILDNSAYEFFIKGEQIDLDKFKQTIEDLNPTYYILPDVLMEKNRTLKLTMDFLSSHTPDCGSKPMAVLQGNNPEEMMTCLDTYRQWGIDDICIPFHNRFFHDYDDWCMLAHKTVKNIEDSFKNEYHTDILTDDMKYAIGRVCFMESYKSKFAQCNWIHMLGSHCPFEKSFYTQVSDVVSMDTGYPVKLGYTEVQLGTESKKPNIIIDNFFNEKLTNQQIEYIKTNIHIFKDEYQLLYKYEICL